MIGRSRPFYKAGPVMRLEKIAAADFAAFIESRFQGSGIKPEDGLGDAIVRAGGRLFDAEAGAEAERAVLAEVEAAHLAAPLEPGAPLLGTLPALGAGNTNAAVNIRGIRK